MNSKRYLYFENNFYVQKEFQRIDITTLLSKRYIKVNYFDKPKEIMDIDSFFNEVKLD